MPTGVYDERGELLVTLESDIQAFAFAMKRQRCGKLTTILTADNLEVLFAPATPAGNRAETALEYQARMNSVVKEEMEKADKNPYTSNSQNALHTLLSWRK